MWSQKYDKKKARNQITLQLKSSCEIDLIWQCKTYKFSTTEVRNRFLDIFVVKGAGVYVITIHRISFYCK